MSQFLELTGGASKRSDTVAGAVLEILTDLETQLDETLAHLQQNEIAAAFALSKWISDTDAEINHLHTELERKNASLEKLYVAQPAALGGMAKALAIQKESESALNGAIEDLEEKRSWYRSETERRSEENAIIDECIHIFKEQVRNLASGTSLKQ